MAVTQETFVKLVHIARNAKVVKGGRRFRFGTIMVVGNQNGSVGIGTGKATEVMEANEKAKNDGLKRMKKISLKEGRTLHHDVIGKFGSGKVIMRAAPPGTGIIAGGPLRALCEAAGIKDIVAKSVGSSNPHNMLKAALDALMSVRSPKAIADYRRLKVGEVISRREKVNKTIEAN